MTSLVSPTAAAPGSRQHGNTAPQTPGALFERITDFGIAAAIFVIPLCLGGIRPLGQLLLVTLSLTTTAAWLAARCTSRDAQWRWLGIEPLLLAGIALVTLQITPLPSDWLELVSPKQRQLLWLQRPHGLLPQWSTVSVIPSATRSGLANLVAYCLLFLVTAQRVRETADARRIMCWVAGSAVGMSVLGLVQMLCGSPKFFGVIEIDGISAAEVVHGSFVNRNHLAQFLALGAGPLLMFALAEPATAPFRRRLGAARGTLTGEHPAARAAAWAGLACVCIATILSLSRGGMLALLAAVVVSLAVGQRHRLFGGRAFPGMLVVAAASIVALFLPWADAVETRVLQNVASLDIEQIDQQAARRTIWTAVARGIADFPWLGTGIGSHRCVYPMYLDQPDDQMEYATAESGYLQLALEAGVAGLLLAGIALAWIISRCLRAAASAHAAETSAPLTAVLAAVTASALHAAVETGWFMPGCMMLLIPLAACGAALSTPHRQAGAPRGFRVHRFTWGAALLAVASAGWWLIPLKLQDARDAECWNALAALEPRGDPPSAPAPEDIRRRLDAIGPLVANHPRLHLRMAKAYLQVFEWLQQSARNPMSLSDLRQAATAAEFRSIRELHEWLERATDGHAQCLQAARTHLQRSLEECPLEGRAYVYAAELCFLEGAGSDRQRQYVAQALRVRPYDPQVLFALGQLEWHDGRRERTFACWKQAYHRSRAWEKTITDLLINAMPAEQFLQTFEPDWLALRDLRNRMQQQQHPEYEIVGKRFADAAVAQSRRVEEGRERVLLDACTVYQEIGDDDAALQCALAAVETQPHDYAARFAAARLLHRQQRFADALPHLRWCLRRRPNDIQSAALLKSALEQNSWRNDPPENPRGRFASTSPSHPIRTPEHESLPVSQVVYESLGTGADRTDGIPLHSADPPGSLPRKD